MGRRRPFGAYQSHRWGSRNKENEYLPSSSGRNEVSFPRTLHGLILIMTCSSIALMKDDNAVVFGEDVAFGGVFRCTMVRPIYP